MTNTMLTDRVTEERWHAAQRWEEQYWINAQRMRARWGKNYVWRTLSLFGLVSKYRGDDWNHWWRDHFHGYDFLPPALKNALEVGCGPYTNLRLIAAQCRLKHLVLSDPLIRTYVRFKLTFVAEMYRKALCVLDDHPLEDLPFADNYFDLVVMINVLDHVRDAHLCMQNTVRVTKPGGFLIVGQDLSNGEDSDALQRSPGVVGHPIMLNQQWFQPYFEQRFEPIISKVLRRTEGRAPENHYGTLLFAAKRL